MNLFNLRFINFRINILSISIFISLLSHSLAFLILKKNTIFTTRGDKFIPIELISTNSIAGAGESLNEEIKEDKLKIKKEILESKKEEIINESDIKENNKIEKENINKYSSDQTQIKTQRVIKSNKEENNKIEKENINKYSSDQTKVKTKRGIKSNKEENNKIEKGSLKGKGKIKITCLRCVSPKYPTRALRRGAEGKPLVKVWINKLGKVTKSELIKSSGNDSIDKAALLAANKSTFHPIPINNETFQIEYEAKIKK